MDNKEYDIIDARYNHEDEDVRTLNNISLNSSYDAEFYIIECNSWTIKNMISLMHGITMKMKTCVRLEQYLAEFFSRCGILHNLVH